MAARGTAGLPHHHAFGGVSRIGNRRVLAHRGLHVLGRPLARLAGVGARLLALQESVRQPGGAASGSPWLCEQIDPGRCHHYRYVRTLLTWYVVVARHLNVMYTSRALFREWCVIVGPDWMHWKVQGDWHFDPEYWPDPSAMVKEINGLGMEVKPSATATPRPSLTQ